jgi:FemAB-related protein (PEP-CTERM system-associated)
LNNLQSNGTVTERAKLSAEAWRQWDDYVKRHAHGSVFHLSNWQRLIESSFRHQPLHLCARNGSGEIAGILPLFLVRSTLFGRMLISTPQAAYGGILADTESVSNELCTAAKNIARNQEVQFMELRNLHNASEDPGLQSKDLYVTFRQELYSDPEKNFALIPRKTRAECREGIRNGLEFKVGKIGIDEFYSVYSQNVRDLGTPVFSKRLFANGVREFGSDCKIFSVHWNGKLVSAVWTLFYKDEVIPYYGGSIRAYNRLAVNNFMYWMLIRYGCENGYKVYDFGRSKKGTGSFDFKKRWGQYMEDLPYQYFLVKKKSLPDTSPLNPKFSLGISLWRKLPLPIANTFGPFIANHLV